MLWLSESLAGLVEDTKALAGGAVGSPDLLCDALQIPSLQPMPPVPLVSGLRMRSRVAG